MFSTAMPAESRLKETVIEKNPDFSWILKELSLAIHYDTIQDILNSYFEQADIYLENIENKFVKTLLKRENLKEIQKYGIEKFLENLNF